MEQETLLNLSKEKIDSGYKIIEKLKQFENINGVFKLQRKIQQEISILENKLKLKKITQENVFCTNLIHLEAIVKVICQIKYDIKNVNHVYKWEKKKILVDIVTENGLSWIKVIARNKKSLEQAVTGDASYGTRNIIDQAKDFIDCSLHHTCFFKTPQITFYFTNGLDENISNEMKKMGIVIKTINDDSIINKIPLLNSEDKSINKSFVLDLNLDVTTMIAYVSNLTNGSCNFIFKEKILTQQAEWERAKPVKPILDQLFEGKQLYCCKIAEENFKNIMKTVGGQNEQSRAEELLKRIKVLPDDYLTEEQTSNTVLNLGGKIKERSRTVFDFGKRLKAVTVSANEGFIRAAEQQSIRYTVFLHESRALTENKENFGEILS